MTKLQKYTKALFCKIINEYSKDEEKKSELTGNAVDITYKMIEDLASSDPFEVFSKDEVYDIAVEYTPELKKTYEGIIDKGEESLKNYFHNLFILDSKKDYISQNNAMEIFSMAVLKELQEAINRWIDKGRPLPYEGDNYNG